MSSFDKTNEVKLPWIRTPLIESTRLSRIAGCRIFLKLDNLQPSGSFKSRGIGNYVLHAITTLDEAPLHFCASSGGNAGLACTYAARGFGRPVTVCVPLNTKAAMKQKILRAGATNVCQQGAVLREADQYLRENILKLPEPGPTSSPERVAITAVKVKFEPDNKEQTAVYCPPFDHQAIWEGNGTLIWEIVEQLGSMNLNTTRPPRANVNNKGYSQGKYFDDDYYKLRLKAITQAGIVPYEARKVAEVMEPPTAIVCSVGGGGLINGLVESLANLALSVNDVEMAKKWSKVAVVGVETDGADSMAASIQAKKPTVLKSMTSKATSLGALRVSDRTLELALGWRAGNEEKNGCELKGMKDFKTPIRSVVLSDKEAAKACAILANEERILVELACGVSVGAVLFNRERLEKALGRQIHKDDRIVVVVCGGSDVDAKKIVEWDEFNVSEEDDKMKERYRDKL